MTYLLLISRDMTLSDRLVLHRANSFFISINLPCTRTKMNNKTVSEFLINLLLVSVLINNYIHICMV